MSREIKEDITEAVEEYSIDDELLDLYDKEKIIESDKIIAREEVLKEGAYNKTKEIAKKSLEQGLDTKLISNITGLSVDEINNLK